MSGKDNSIIFDEGVIERLKGSYGLKETPVTPVIPVTPGV